VQQGIETVTADVQAALDELVEIGFVVHTTTSAGSASYGLNRGKLSQFRLAVSDATSPPERISLM